MLNFSKWILCLCIWMALQSCATTSQDAEGLGMGTTNICINNNIATVTFRPYPMVPPNLVEDYLLYRSAQITIDNSFDYFVVKKICTCPPDALIFSKPAYRQYLVGDRGVSPDFLNKRHPGPYSGNLFCDPRCKKCITKTCFVLQLFTDPVSAHKVSPYVFDAQEVVSYVRPDYL